MDEDLDGPVGFESKVERVRLLPPRNLRCFAPLATGGGAVGGPGDITSEIWKPYQASTPPAATVSRQSAAVDMRPFGWPDGPPREGRRLLFRSRRRWKTGAECAPCPFAIDAGRGRRSPPGCAADHSSGRLRAVQPGCARHG